MARSVSFEVVKCALLCGSNNSWAGVGHGSRSASTLFSLLAVAWLSLLTKISLYNIDRSDHL